MNGDDLFYSLFSEDPEGQKLRNIPGGEELFNEFMLKFVECSKEMYVFGIKQKDVRDKEVGEFWKCINDVKQSNTLDATRMINEFMETKRRVLINFVANI